MTPAARPVDAAGGPAAGTRRAGRGRALYLHLLGWAFSIFSSLRMLSYLPTLWAIHLSGDSSQHSLWTWLTWFGANLTMAAWLYEQDGQRVSRVTLVSLANAVMCLSTVALIVWYRL